MIKDIIVQSDFIRLAYRIAKWHTRYITGQKVFPLACGFYISNKCNFRCNFCNIWRLKPGFQMPEEEARTVIKQLGAMGLVYFSISGGEPLMVPYVVDLLSYAKKSGILFTHIVSNGYLMDPEKAKKLADACVSEISFSLDGNEVTHDANRVKRGAFNKLMEAVHHVKRFSPGTRIVLNTILTPDRPDDALFAVNKAKELGVQIKVQPANDHPSFGLEDNAARTRRSLEKQEIQRLFDVIDFLKGSPHVVNSRPFLDNYKAFLVSPEKLLLVKDDCIFGYHHVEFFNNSVFPCLEGCEWVNGFDVSGKKIEEILLSPEFLQRLQDLKKCSSCRKNYYVCYYEPRLNFPIWNFIKSRLLTSRL